jgi:hypothetical protein
VCRHDLEPGSKGVTQGRSGDAWQGNLPCGRVHYKGEAGWIGWCAGARPRIGEFGVPWPPMHVARMLALSVCAHVFFSHVDARGRWGATRRPTCLRVRHARRCALHLQRPHSPKPLDRKA